MQVACCHQPAFKITNLVKQQSSTTTNNQAQADPRTRKGMQSGLGHVFTATTTTIFSMQNRGTAGNRSSKT